MHGPREPLKKLHGILLIRISIECQSLSPQLHPIRNSHTCGAGCSSHYAENNMAQQLPPIRACIFDVDGTLINSEDIYTDIYNKILSEYDKPPYPWKIKATQQSRGTPVCECTMPYTDGPHDLHRVLNAYSTGLKFLSLLLNGRRRKKLTRICSATAKCFLG